MEITKITLTDGTPLTIEMVWNLHSGEKVLIDGKPWTVTVMHPMKEEPPKHHVLCVPDNV